MGLSFSSQKKSGKKYTAEECERKIEAERRRCETEEAAKKQNADFDRRTMNAHIRETHRRMGNLIATNKRLQVENNSLRGTSGTLPPPPNSPVLVLSSPASSVSSTSSPLFIPPPPMNNPVAYVVPPPGVSQSPNYIPSPAISETGSAYNIRMGGTKSRKAKRRNKSSTRRKQCKKC